MAETDPDNWTDHGLELGTIFEMCFKSHMAVAGREYGGTEMMTSAKWNVIEMHPQKFKMDLKEIKNYLYTDPRDYRLLLAMLESH